MRENLTTEMKKLIDNETEKEIKRVLKDVSYRDRTRIRKEKESEFRKVKAQKLTENFMKAEPMLIQQLEDFTR